MNLPSGLTNANAIMTLHYMFDGLESYNGFQFKQRDVNDTYLLMGENLVKFGLQIKFGCQNIQSGKK